MNWDMIGAIGELAGALAVVVSLLYVGKQIKHNSRVTEVEAVDLFVTKLADLSYQISANPQLAGLLARVQFDEASPGDLSKDERIQVGYVYYAAMTITSSLFEHWRQGLLSKSNFDSYAARNAGLMSAPYFRTIWPYLRPSFGTEFIAYIEAGFDAPENASDGDEP